MRSKEVFPQVAPGARVRLAADWGALRAGEELVVNRLDGNGLVVSPSEGAKEESWIPASLIPNSSVSRAWSFRPRKLNHDKNSISDSKSDIGKTPPCISSAPSPIKANAGEVARLAVQVSGAFEGAVVSWRREGEELCFEQDDRLRLGQSAGFYYLEISRCRPSDSGVYQCNIQCENGSCSSSIALRITG